MTGFRSWGVVVALLCGVGCGDSSKPEAPSDKPASTAPGATTATATPSSAVAPKTPATTATATASAAASTPTPAAGGSAGGPVAPDGKYENVMVEGKPVPMVQVMNGGKEVLVDTDGAKPRTWEEQYKQKSSTGAGQLDIHKSDVNKNNKFDDDPVDRQGAWQLDSKGNITKR